MDAAADDSRAVTPFGFVGLCLSLAALAGIGLLVAFVIGAIGAVCVGLVLGWQAMMEAARAMLALRDDDTGRRALFVALIVFHVGLSVAIFLMARWRGGTAWRDLIGWRGFRLADKTIWVIMAGALIYSALANSALEHVLPHPAVQLTIPADLVASAALFALAVIVAPVTEELLFRGWIYTGLRFHWGLWPALLTTSALFAGAHYESTHLYALAVFPIGLALGIIRERTGSIKASILFHAANNFVALALAALSRG